MSTYWWRDASCAQIGSTVFFDKDKGDRKAAIAVCKVCPVLEACWESLVREEAGRGRADLHGIRAGKTPYERYAKLGNVCPECRGERDRPGRRLCSGCAHLEERMYVSAG